MYLDMLHHHMFSDISAYNTLVLRWRQVGYVRLINRETSDGGAVVECFKYRQVANLQGISLFSKVCI